MPESEWGEERIAELRRRAQQVEDVAAKCAEIGAAVAHGYSPELESAISESIGAHSDFYERSLSPTAVLSLLDALESARRERDEANEALTIAYMVGHERGKESVSHEAT